MKSSRRSLVGLVLLILGISAASQWWGNRHETALGQRVAALAAPGDVHMLSSDTCGICTVARQWFTAHEVSFTECSIERDADCRQRFEALHAPGTPVILVRGHPELGFSPERLARRLEGGRQGG